MILRFIWKNKMLRPALKNVNEKSNEWGLGLPDIKSFMKLQ